MDSLTVATKPHRFSVGEFDLSVFSDGFITLPSGIIAPDAPPDILPGLMERYSGRTDSADISVNIPLIRKGEDLILVDTGSGDKFQASAGRLLDNLLAAGVDPAAVTKVVLTHAHPDHAGGIIRPDGSLTFPNAGYYVSAIEWDFWTAKGWEFRVPSALHEFALGAQRDLGAIIDRVCLVKAGDDIVSGLRVLATPGHTPGHISLEMEGGDGLLISADAINNALISFEHPQWRFGFDTDQDLAVRTRTALIDRVATDRTRMLGYHWPTPGAGMAERKGGGYRFLAIP
ncbi:MBL fold metallo-hydrolase [Lacibacterium aquatile]|uniref:MBL fold metallo-hydrolase n=1 Tax=Lacibacterium aquatile TaxID=1168082 RepID=A0ABW5DX92_9PROT